MSAHRDGIDGLVQRMIEDEHVDWKRASKDVDVRTAGALQQIESLRRFTVRAMGTRTERQSHSGQFWGPLAIRGVLGSGANARVLRAWDEQLQHEVALKVAIRGELEQGVRGRVLNEGRRMVRVHHNNVVRIYGVLEHAGQLGLSMELVEGQTLEQRVRVDGSWSEAEARDAGVALADALCALHEAGIVHQDVKAQNVMRETGGRLVLMDLGSGVELGSDNVLPGGTPYYMAPELLTGGAPSRASDVYSLGVLLHYLVTGSFPYEGASLRELQAAHQSPKTLRLSDRRPGLSAGFVNAVERALDPDPEQRFQTAGELREALTVSDGEPSRPPSRRWPLAAAAGACALVIWGAWTWVNRGFEVEAQMYRYEDATRRTELLSGAGVEVGDMLMLEMELSKPVHVYVLNEDDQGRAYVLFPIAVSALQNPLPAGKHELPGVRDNGSRISWEVSSTGGRERLLIVAGRDPVESIERALEQIPEASLAYPSVDASLLRGIGGVTELPSSSDGSNSAIPGIQELVQGQERSRDRWVRQFILTNP